ncbi:MAG: hypothetical protein ACK4RT_02885 [Erythrobacter sp.]
MTRYFLPIAAALPFGSTAGNTMTEVIPSAGDCKIDLFLMRNAARRG